MKLLFAALGFALAACNTPRPSLHLALAGPPSQACPSTDCSKVPLACATVMNIQIIDPGDPKTKWLDECVDVPAEHSQNMCALDSIDLSSTPIPVRDLEVQVALYPKSALPVDAMNKSVCPSTIAFGAANGFPEEQAAAVGPSPAVGGRAFYHPGDPVVQVTLGCTDLDAINASCVISDDITVVATIDEFDAPHQAITTDAGIANQLMVWVGEPHNSGPNTYALNTNDIHPLTQSGEPGDGIVATWGLSTELQLVQNVCIEVHDDSSTNPDVLRCVPARPDSQLNLRGAWVSHATIDQILTAAQLSSVPSQGLTIGIVLDQGMNPAANIAVAASAGTVQYLNGDGLSGNVTSDSGIFISLDAPFGTLFSVRGQSSPPMAIGGLVQSKITAVILTAPSTD